MFSPSHIPVLPIMVAGAFSLFARDGGAAPAATTNRVREAAVAGLFYPADAKALGRALDRHLAAASARDLPDLRGLICPHAGYDYSGPTAAHSYKLLTGRRYDTVVILAASHYAWFEGVSVPVTEAYETPLGRVPVSARARELAAKAPFVLEPRCALRRPQWAHLAPKAAPPEGEDTPETWEHSVEVQVPFLQRVLTNFSILPVVFGDAEPEAVARGLAAVLDDRTLVIASTDLSHYHPYDEARSLDQQTVKWICGMDFAALQARRAADAACGRMPVLTLMHLARLKGWQPQLLDYRNSGDTAGDKGRVVGYAAIAFAGAGKGETATATPAATAQTPANYSAEERQFLLALARRTLRSVTTNGSLPAVKAEEVPAKLREPRGCFVTLTKAGALRGCIGNLQAGRPLYQAVMDNARGAALEDSRFSPVTAGEVPQLHLEISVLTEPRPLAFDSPADLLEKLVPHRDGVVLRLGARRSTFLPQVWEQLPDKEQFLSHLCRKAGCAPDAWRGSDVGVSIYHVEAFEEPKR